MNYSMDSNIPTGQAKVKANQLYKKISKTQYKIGFLDDKDIEFFLNNMDLVIYDQEGSSKNELGYLMERQKKDRKNKQDIQYLIANGKNIQEATKKNEQDIQYLIANGKNIQEATKKNADDIQFLIGRSIIIEKNTQALQKLTVNTNQSIQNLKKEGKQSKKQSKKTLQKLQQQIQNHSQYQQANKTSKKSKFLSTFLAFVTFICSIITGVTYLVKEEEYKSYSFKAGIISLIGALILLIIPVITMWLQKQFKRPLKKEEVNEVDTQNNLVQGNMMTQ